MESTPVLHVLNENHPGVSTKPKKNCQQLPCHYFAQSFIARRMIRHQKAACRRGVVILLRLVQPVFAEPPSGVLGVVSQDHVRPCSLEAHHGLVFSPSMEGGRVASRANKNRRRGLAAFGCAPVHQPAKNHRPVQGAGFSLFRGVQQ